MKRLEDIMDHYTWMEHSMDGTFHVTPQPFDSLLTIHLEKEGHSIPVFYVLLPSRIERVYTAVLRRIHAILTPMIVGINHVMTDYQQALMNAAVNIFDNQGRA